MTYRMKLHRINRSVRLMDQLLLKFLQANIRGKPAYSNIVFDYGEIHLFCVTGEDRAP